MKLLPSILSLAAALLINAQQQPNGRPTYKGALLLKPGRINTRCLTAASDTNNAVVTIETCTGEAKQKWSFTTGSVGTGPIKVFANKCLAITNNQNADGVKLIIQTCNANANQNFYYNYWSNELKWKTNGGRCVDLTGGSTAAGNRIQILSCNGNPNQIWNTGYMVNSIPDKTQNGQTGTNKCSGANSASAKCQTLWINSINDFCLWGPDTKGPVGARERGVVAYCLNTSRGSRTLPKGTLKGVHFLKTKDYVQITGVGDFTSMNIPKGDDGGELDPHGPDANGNPVGGLVYGNSFSKDMQYHEWTSFMSDDEFCIRACTGPNARKNCQHIYDVMGCYWNMPANYNKGFETCDADNDLPMGVYGTSTWHQGVKPTPPPHPAAKSSNCVSQPTVTPGVVRRDLNDLLARSPLPTAQPL